MNTAFNILVIALGCLLGIFLILSIVVTILVLKLVSALKQIVAKGEHLVDSAEAIGDTLRRNAGAVGILRVMMQLMNSMNGTKRRKD